MMAGTVEPSSSTFELRPCDSVSLASSIFSYFHEQNNYFEPQINQNTFGYSIKMRIFSILPMHKLGMCLECS